MLKYLMCNLKSNLTFNEALSHCEKIKKIDIFTFELVLFPPFVHIPYFDGINYSLGSQNISEYPMGAYTGEINAEQLKSLNVKYTLIGHSERRKYFKESEETLTKKIKQALDNKIKVVFCVGETKEEYDRKKNYVVVEKQIARVLNNFSSEEFKNIIIAYEPVWAIGTGITPSKREIEEMTLFIKKLTKEYYNLEIDVLYGGSVDDENIAEIKEIISIDGLLVGGASLDIKKLNNIINFFDKH